MNGKQQKIAVSEVTGQGGSALLVSLVMLLLISLIAVGAMQGSILQERMSTNLLDRELAFQSAEAALRGAEQQLQTQTADWRSNQTFVYTVNGVNADGNAPPDWIASPQEVDAAARTGGLAGTVQNVARQPDYYIEEIDTPVSGSSTALEGEDPGAVVFRITARGFGGTEESVVIVRSVYRTE